jgi:hypothetical protein
MDRQTRSAKKRAATERRSNQSKPHSFISKPPCPLGAHQVYLMKDQRSSQSVAELSSVRILTARETFSPVKRLTVLLFPGTEEQARLPSYEMTYIYMRLYVSVILSAVLCAVTGSMDLPGRSGKGSERLTI